MNDYNRMIDRHFKPHWLNWVLMVAFPISVIIIGLTACDTGGGSYPGGNRGAPDDLVGVGTRSVCEAIAATAELPDPCGSLE